MRGAAAGRKGRPWLLLVAILFSGIALPAEAQPIPAGASAAVLSFIDAAAGRVEVVRHWPAAPTDVDVYPFVPYLWGGCPGRGAMMMLVIAVGSGPPLTGRIAHALERAARLPVVPAQAAEVARIAAALRTPGDPVSETIKAAAPWISDLFTYERLGYAVFLFVHWTGTGCGVTLRTVPEGYGIPFVD
jgi:hypothetical protein